MKAAVVNVLGQPPRYQDFPEPKAGEGEVLIDVRAAGLHPIVKARASGSHYSSDGVVPLIPGVDGVGRIGWEPRLLRILESPVWIDGAVHGRPSLDVHPFAGRN